MTNDSRKRRKHTSLPNTLIDGKDGGRTAKFRRRLLNGSNNIESTERRKDRFILARASVVKDKYRSLVLAYDKPWQDLSQPTLHWDHLVAEAKWMWNDIAQERIWKQAVAKALAYEAVEYKKSRSSKQSSLSTDDVINIPRDDLFVLPMETDLGLELMKMFRAKVSKSNAEHEKYWRAFKQECEAEELSAVHGFKSDDNLNLLDVKIPILPCIAAPNEPEKDYFSMAPIKAPGNKKLPPRGKSKSNIPLMLNGEELASPQMIDRSLDSNRHKGRQSQPNGLGSAQGIGRNIRGPHHRPGRPPKEYSLENRGLAGSDLSLSQTDLEGRQEPPTIDDFLARSDDRLLFITAGDLYSNWGIVSDVMASAGCFMSPEACKERHQSIENTIKRHQSQMIRPGEQEAMGDILLKQLRTSEAKESIRKRIPDPLASKYTQPTCTAHRKRIQKQKANTLEEEGPPKYHVSQKKLTAEVLKTLGGRLSNPRESWTKARKQIAARAFAQEHMNHFTAAGIAPRQGFNRVGASSQPVINPAAAAGAFDASKQRQNGQSPTSPTSPPQQPQQQQQQHAPGGMQLSENLSDPANWTSGGAPGGGSTSGNTGGYIGTSGLANVGTPIPQASPMTGHSGPPGHVHSSGAPGHVHGPWIPTPSGIPHLPNMIGAGKPQGQPVGFGGSALTPLRHGFNVRNTMPQHLMENQGSHDPQQQLNARMPSAPPRAVRPGMQNPLPAPYGHPQSSQYLAQLLAKYKGHPACLQQYLQMPTLKPERKMMVMQMFQESKRMGLNGNLQNPGAMGPSAPMQRIVQSPTGSHVMSPPGSGGRKIAATSTGDQQQFGGSPNLGNYPTPAVLEHPSQYGVNNSNRAGNPAREFLEPSPRSNIRPRSQLPSFSYEHGAAINPLDTANNGATSGNGMSLGFQNGNVVGGGGTVSGVVGDSLSPTTPPLSRLDMHQDMSTNTVDVRHALHGGPPSDSNHHQLMDGHQNHPLASAAVFQETNQDPSLFRNDMRAAGGGGGGNGTNGGGNSGAGGGNAMTQRQMSSFARIPQRPYAP